MLATFADAPHSRNDFEVAIMCALTHEADAVIALFDNYWDDNTHELRPSLSEDKNEYTFGRIGLHNVVVVVLRGMGKKEASSAVAAMHPTFRNIQFCLVVGIRAVAPYTDTQNGSEIIFGDVVISSCVIQSDLGRQYGDVFERKDTLENNLARPSQELQGILKRLERELHYEQLEERMRGFVKVLQSRKNIYTYPGTEHDHLYATEYTHMHRVTGTCNECKRMRDAPDHACAKAKLASCVDLGCETSQLIPRTRPSKPTDGGGHPFVWFGRFASGDHVLTSAAHREELHDKQKVIGFEMEGSGAWEHFPTVVIKSGCDYADSHTNKEWHKYCAGTAPACTKAFLQQWRKKEKSIKSRGVPSTSDRAQSLPTKTLLPRVPPPRSCNSLFLGRKTELAKIELQLYFSDSIDNGKLAEPKVLVVQGLGGNGKSELCLRYLKTHEGSYWATFWVDGKTDKSLASGFERIATQLGITGGNIEDVRCNLAALRRRWLFITDNADDPELDLAHYLPEGIGHVLITTRNSELDIFRTQSTLSLKGLDENDALELLLKAARIPAQEQASLTMSAQDILNVLGFHTPAIIQAGAYIRKTGNLNSYVTIFKEQRKRVLEYCAPQAQAQYGSVYATFEISASKLHQEADERPQQSAADALDLLRLFAFMDTRGPFERIFSDARDFATACTVSGGPATNADDDTNVDDIESLARRHAHLLTRLAYAKNDPHRKYRWREACDKLSQYSMLSCEKDENGDEVLLFHPLVLAWALVRLSKDAYRQSWLSVATAIFLNSRGIKKYLPASYRLITHARTCAGYVLKEWWTETSNLLYLFLLYQLGCMLLLNRDDAVTSILCRCLEIGLEATEKERWGSFSGRESVHHLLGRQAYNVGNIDKSILLTSLPACRETRRAEKIYHFDILTVKTYTQQWCKVQCQATRHCTWALKRLRSARIFPANLRLGAHSSVVVRPPDFTLR